MTNARRKYSVVATREPEPGVTEDGAIEFGVLVVCVDGRKLWGCHASIEQIRSRQQADALELSDLEAVNDWAKRVGRIEAQNCASNLKPPMTIDDADFEFVPAV